jgi:hypothetical protein
MRHGAGIVLAAAVAGAGALVTLAATRSLSGTGPPPAPAPTPSPRNPSSAAVAAPAAGFDDVTARAGVTHVHGSGPPLLYPTQIMGPGCAFGDYDADGWVDLYVPGSTTPPTRGPRRAASLGKLFRNRRDGTFHDATREARLDAADGTHGGEYMGATFADIDGDGFPELYLTGYGASRLFHNEGDGTFRDATGRSGLGMQGRFAAASAWADYDRDGRLDVYVTTYLDFRYPEADVAPKVTNWRGFDVPAPLVPPLYDGTPHALFHNEGGGRFTDVTARAGVADNGDRLGKGLGALWCDVTGDGWPDLVLANDGVRKTLFVNRKDGTFESVAERRWMTDHFGSMGVCAGDVDGDGYLDIHFTNWFTEPNALYVNRRGSFFVESSEPAGLAERTTPLVGWGTEFLDYDSDGKLDLIVACGSTFAARYDWKTYLRDPNLIEPQPMLLFRGDGQGRFIEATAGSGLSAVSLAGRGLAVADYDHDGAPDVCVASNNGPTVLLRNRGTRGAGWLSVRLASRRSNRAGIGARVTVRCGRDAQIREIHCGSSYLSAGAPEAHFGLGSHRVVDELTVQWPSGGRTTRSAVPAGQRIEVREER